MKRTEGKLLKRVSAIAFVKDIIKCSCCFGGYKVAHNGPAIRFVCVGERTEAGKQGH
jgi:hypothetical protein